MKVLLTVGSDQQLYVRLFLRKHHWIRVSKISYEDIATDLVPILDSLHQRKLLDNGEKEHSNAQFSKHIQNFVV